MYINIDIYSGFRYILTYTYITEDMMFTTENKKMDFFHLYLVGILALSHLVNASLVINYSRFDSRTFEVKNFTNLPLGMMNICFPSYVLSFLLMGRAESTQCNFSYHPYASPGYNVVFFSLLQ